VPSGTAPRRVKVLSALRERLYLQGNTIVLVTHEHDIALHAHRIIHVRDGKVEKDEKIK